MARKEVGFVVTDDYKTWIEEVKNKIRNSQIKASVRINYEMLDLYWNLGVAICEKQNQAKWGDAFLKVMSNDLQKAFPGVSGFSVENLKHIRYWYNFYTNNEKWLQGVTQIESMVKSIPWGHNQRIMYKCKDIDEALFYIQKTMDNNWSRNVLVHQIESDLYARQGKAINNFQVKLPEPQSDLAEQTLKDPYNFDFLALREEYNERELEDALVEQITQFLLELGTGFSFIGKQVEIKVGEARLFYTAITRAERLLYLTGSEIHPGLKTKKKHSVFTADLKHSDMRYDTSLDILADKIEPVPRFDDNELPTDFSSVKSYLTCPFMYKLQNIYGYNAAVPELFGFGQTTHTILERLHQKYKDRIPTEKEIFDIVEDTFMLKHVFPSNDPINRPGSYERAKNLVHEIMKKYVDTYSDDFCRIRQDEARFELLVDEALITGSIDLLLKEDKTKNINAAEVIDFKSMEVPDGLEEFDWREMSLQVQLYSRAAKEVIGENAETGYVHTLKNNKRVEVPVDETAVKNAIGAIEWAVKGILQEDFPMRACSSNCKNCDYRALCRQEREPFKRQELPPVINTPVGERVIAAFEEEDGEF